MLAETSNLTKRIGEPQTKQQGNGMIKSRHPLFLAASHHNAQHETIRVQHLQFLTARQTRQTQPDIHSWVRKHSTKNV